MNDFEFIFIFLKFPFFWCFIAWVLSLLGGWSSLANHYAVPKTHYQVKWHSWRSINVQRISVFPTSYSGVIKLAFEENDLYLSTFLLFRVGHQTLKLPYREMTIEKKTIFFRDVLKITMKREAGVNIIFFGHDKDRIIEKINEQPT